MYCRKCGKQIPDDSNYCQHCGNKVLIVTSFPEPDSEPKKTIEPEHTKVKDSWSLIDFAHEFGKMQILKAADDKGQLIRYAVFTKETRVDFDKELQDADSVYISKHKQTLLVKNTPNGLFLLEKEKEGKKNTIFSWV